jgi:hypothetical protein
VDIADDVHTVTNRVAGNTSPKRKNTMKNAQLANCKSETIYFADRNGYVYFCFGQTDEVILCERLQENTSSKGEFTLSPMIRISHDRFDRIVKREDVIVCGGQVTYRVQPKRQSTTAKVTKATANLIRRYILATGSGVMVRHRGVERGVTRVFEVDGDNRAKSTGFLFHDGPCTRAKNCTISKATLAAIQTWAKRTDELGRLVLIDAADGTVGTAAGRYVVSEPNGLVFNDEPLDCPDLAAFADNTLGSETVGVWRDCGKVYVDANVSFDTLGTALAYGRAASQIAIFDTVDGVVIDC